MIRQSITYLISGKHRKICFDLSYRSVQILSMLTKIIYFINASSKIFLLIETIKSPSSAPLILKMHRSDFGNQHTNTKTVAPTLPYSDSQKHESSCLLSDCFSCISPEPLELKKKIFTSIYILL